MTSNITSEPQLEPELEVVKASEITPKEIKWLWYPYIPFGKVTLLQGDPGDGKSKLMLSVSAILSCGKPLPFTDESEAHEPMTIIYQTSEDDADDTVVPRFIASDGDSERLIFISENEKSLTFGDQRIRSAITKFGARLLILDPLSSKSSPAFRRKRLWYQNQKKSPRPKRDRYSDIPQNLKINSADKDNSIISKNLLPCFREEIIFDFTVLPT